MDLKVKHKSNYPIEKMYKTFDWDDIHEVNGVNDVTMFLEKPKANADFHQADGKMLTCTL